MTRTQEIIIVVVLLVILTSGATRIAGVGPMTPLGIRNNNPGNLRPLDSGSWVGQSGENGGYLQFSDSAYGLRALTHNLYSYGANDGINTLTAVAARWAPASENDPVAYAKTLSDVSGFGVNQNIDLTDRATTLAVARGIVQAEEGQRLPGVPWFTDAQISAAQALYPPAGSGW